MRIALLVSLIVHGAGITSLALLGVVHVRAEPGRTIGLSIRADALPDIEPPPAEPPVPDAPPAPESWEFPAEVPALEEIEAPQASLAVDAAPVRAVRLLKPLARPARARAVIAPESTPPAAARIARAGELRPPRLREDLSPVTRYPARARRMGLEGSVMLLVSVGADGAVAKVEIASSSGHEELDRAAADAAKLWRFEPARRDGEAVAYDVRVPVEFKLTDA